MKNWLFAFILFAFIAACTQQKPESVPVEKTKLEIKEGYYFINGEKTFINAIGYEIGARPGQHPKDPRGLELSRMKNDLKLIKEAGFNAIRIWEVLYSDELKVVQESGLKLVFGIEVNSHGNFADSAFIASAIHKVDTALSYTKDFDCIITYLIMNEPMPQHIKDVGAQATRNLWETLIQLIHEKHPGIPVSISGNSAITEYLDMNIFDLYSYNAYDYGAGINYALTFNQGNSFLQKINRQNKPLILTEFGYSVSRDGSGEYGGNTLKAQQSSLLEYYRNLLDAGCAGACPFYYADGWWKGKEPDVHNDTPEEWFGFWGYSDLLDTMGHPRPVWYALSTYNRALIASPKNQEYYKNEVPVEIFIHSDVTALKIVYLDKVIYTKEDIKPGYFTDKLSFADEKLTDRELVFEFYGQDGKLIKCETILFLTGKDEMVWPTLDIVSPGDYFDTPTKISMELKLKNDTIFTLGNEVRYVFQHHIVWEGGKSESWKIDPLKIDQSAKFIYAVPEKSQLVGIYAGTEIHYGKFVRTIYAQQFKYRDNWADPIRVKQSE